MSHELSPVLKTFILTSVTSVWLTAGGRAEEMLTQRGAAATQTLTQRGTGVTQTLTPAMSNANENSGHLFVAEFSRMCRNATIDAKRRKNRGGSGPGFLLNKTQSPSPEDQKIGHSPMDQKNQPFGPGIFW
jgi:hypothetical protein